MFGQSHSHRVWRMVSALIDARPEWADQDTFDADCEKMIRYGDSPVVIPKGLRWPTLPWRLVLQLTSQPVELLQPFLIGVRTKERFHRTDTGQRSRQQAHPLFEMVGEDPVLSAPLL